MANMLSTMKCAKVGLDSKICHTMPPLITLTLLHVIVHIVGCYVVECVGRHTLLELREMMLCVTIGVGG